MTLDDLIEAAWREDIAHGDLTTDACVDPEKVGEGFIVAKENLVVSGLVPAKRLFWLKGAGFEPLVEDGAHVVAGTKLARVHGLLARILMCERIALNFMMRLSGIATQTSLLVGEARDADIRIVDTRKTTPLHRELEKAAVVHGGGHNHRFGLFDGVMIKDNHIKAVGSITKAVERARKNVHHLVKIEVEVEDLEQLDEALAAGADVVLLDNMDDKTIKAACAQAAGRAILEASGNMDAARIASLKDVVGLDVISVGGLIHQARWADLSLRFV
ncbi:MAG: carboxylating nicotinate-nucleotide diphosphorylase [Proteobacteria bacterium]|nr:carboxylating nicotinate-nucleotide diphosphorylase [Pseudomonadota bacterium]MCP4918832.1 carboxylating nicotinate-nucleotide diphosphorylase [Pseudomonadota bacterium]